ncbi:MAG: heavy-metal-associated domain-containing protein [Salinibacter sp.]
MPLRLVAALSVLLVGIAVPLSASAQSPQQDRVRSPDATVYVDGLACPFCAYGLEKKLKTLDALQKMDVQLEKGRVRLAFVEGHPPTKKQIRQAVKEAGFTARRVELSHGSAPESPSP